MTVLKDAKEIRLDAGPYVNRIDNSGGSFKKYEKSGGYKQAYKDFKQFPADERQDYLIPYGVGNNNDSDNNYTTCTIIKKISLLFIVLTVFCVVCMDIGHTP